MNDPIEGYNRLGRELAEALNRGDADQAAQVKAQFLAAQAREAVEHRPVAGMLYAEGYTKARARRPHIFHG